MCAKPDYYDVGRNKGGTGRVICSPGASHSIHELLGLVESLSYLFMLCNEQILFSSCSSRCILVKKLSTYTWRYLCFESLVNLNHVCTQPYFSVLLSAGVDLKTAEVPLVLSSSTHTLIPCLIGFIGMYCFKAECP